MMNGDSWLPTSTPAGNRHSPRVVRALLACGCPSDVLTKAADLDMQVRGVRWQQIPPRRW